MYCPACTSPAAQLRRSAERLTVRFECSRCGLRFSVSADDILKLAAAWSQRRQGQAVMAVHRLAPLRADEAVMGG